MKQKSKIERLKLKIVPLTLGLFFIVSVLFISNVHTPYLSPLLQRIDYLMYDNIIYHYWLKPPQAVRVVVIDIDSKSILKLGRWPWARDLLAKLLEQLHHAGVVVTALDMVLSEPDVNYALGLKRQLSRLKLPDSLNKLPTILEKLAPDVDSDKKLAKIINAYDVVLAFLFDYEKNRNTGKLPKPLLDNQNQPILIKNASIHSFSGYKGTLNLLTDANDTGGFATNFLDSDGIARHGLLMAKYQDKLYPSLALATAMRFLLTDHITLVWRNEQAKKYLSGIKIDNSYIPTDTQGKVLIPYYGPPGTIDGQVQKVL